MTCMSHRLTVENGATPIGSVSSEASEKCLKEIKALNLGLTEGELVQIANLAPKSEVEFYLVSNVPTCVLMFFNFNTASHALFWCGFSQLSQTLTRPLLPADY